jgi:predicted DsbA family dithiol-disulfide isomerase
MSAPRPTVTVVMISDVICPWCFLGKRRLDKAIAAVPEIDVAVSYQPFFLDPTISPQGMDRRQYMENKFGAERLKTIHDPLIKAGLEDDVPYQFDRITRTPNTMNAHRLIRWAGEQGVQAQVKEALLCAYWRDGQDVGDTSVLIKTADACGMTTSHLESDLKSTKDMKEISEFVRAAQNMGVSGVPTYIIGQTYGVVGAQPVAELAAALREIATRVS